MKEGKRTSIGKQLFSGLPSLQMTMSVLTDKLISFCSGNNENWLYEQTEGIH